MNNEFIITSIERIVFVDKDEYLDKITRYNSDLQTNELIFHLSGYSVVHFGKKIMHTHPNSIRFLPKGSFEKYVVEREEFGSCILISFKTDNPVSDEAFVQNATFMNNVKALFKKSFSVWVSKRDGYYFECISLLYKILSEMQKKDYIPKNEYDKVKPAVDYINEHFLNEKIHSEDLVNLCGVSQSYMNRIFLKFVGMSPIKYANTLKINFACDMIKTTSFPIHEISKMCGYTDVYFFSKQFKKYLGISPTEYLKKYKSSK